jgi:uncharacterized protein
MRKTFLKLFGQSPFPGLAKHAALIRDAAPVFRQAFLAYLDDSPEEFEAYHNKITVYEDQGDGIKRNIRGHLPRGIFLPMDKSQLLLYLREQDKVLDGTQDALHWLSYRKTFIPDEMVDDLLFMVEKIVDVLKSIHPLVEIADHYFHSYSKHHRDMVKGAIRLLREYELESDMVERKMLSDALSYPFENSTSAFHLVQLIRFMGDISNHAENAGDMMRAMIAR